MSILQYIISHHNHIMKNAEYRRHKSVVWTFLNNARQMLTKDGDILTRQRTHPATGRYRSLQIMLD